VCCSEGEESLERGFGAPWLGPRLIRNQRATSRSGSPPARTENDRNLKTAGCRRLAIRASFPGLFMNS